MGVAGTLAKDRRVQRSGWGWRVQDWFRGLGAFFETTQDSSTRGEARAQPAARTIQILGNSLQAPSFLIPSPFHGHFAGFHSRVDEVLGLEL